MLSGVHIVLAPPITNLVLSITFPTAILQQEWGLESTSADSEESPINALSIYDLKLSTSRK